MVTFQALQTVIPPPKPALMCSSIRQHAIDPNRSQL